jgi:hypothetical protein
MITLQPIAMLTPNSAFVYQPSRVSPVKEVSESEFLQCYADGAMALRVSMDGKHVEIVTAYGGGLDCWYVIV